MTNQPISKKITRADLLKMFLNFEKEVAFTGVAFGRIVYMTDESGSITVNKQKQLQKITRTQITLGSNYESRINRDLVKQGEEANFTAQAMYGKSHDSKLVVSAIKEPSKKYLCCVVEHHVKPLTVYFHNKERISFERAKELGLFMPSYFTEKKTAGRGNMSEEKDFHFFTLGFDKIISITLNKTKYIIED